MSTETALTVGELIWRTSPWDHKVHALRELGEVVSQALCEHSARTNAFTEPGDSDPKCQACMLLHGNELADQRGDNRWRFNE